LAPTGASGRKYEVQKNINKFKGNPYTYENSGSGTNVPGPKGYRSHSNKTSP